LNGPCPADGQFEARFLTGGIEPAVQSIPTGKNRVSLEVKIPNARLWSLDDPFLYEVELRLRQGQAEDRVSSYFGMRRVGVMNLPGSGYPYIALNNRPICLQMTLDQSYHPQGFYTYPSDAFMRDEILRSRRLGLNANRPHVKVDVPRKLYWADRLGLLLMADVPNSWGEPTSEMRQEVEQTLRRLARSPRPGDPRHLPRFEMEFHRRTRPSRPAAS
jgi:beta-galactosidase/beta-glucuronidase